MNFNKDMLQLYAVTGRSWSKDKADFYSQVKKSLDGGVTCLQLREKEASYEEFLELAIELKKIAGSYKVPLIINDNIDIAVKSGADGIHLGQCDGDILQIRRQLPKMIIGQTCKTVDQALKAKKAKVDYLGVGAVFKTNTKLDTSVIDHLVINEIYENTKLPIVAIGGITYDNIANLKGLSINGIALVSEIFASDNIVNTCKNLRKRVEEII